MLRPEATHFREAATRERMQSAIAPPGHLLGQIVGVGVDLVDIATFDHNLHVGGQRWLAKVFTDAECSDTNGEIDRLASRFAAKEAVVKALGIGFRDGASPRAVEIGCTAAGTPFVTLRDGAASAADAAGVGEILISMSRDGGFAFAAAWALSPNQ